MLQVEPLVSVAAWPPEVAKVPLRPKNYIVSISIAKRD